MEKNSWAILLKREDDLKMRIQMMKSEVEDFKQEI